jgi:hypothetical protein
MCECVIHYWLVVLTILKNVSSSMGRIYYPIYEMEHKTCLKHFETTNQIILGIYQWEYMRI